MFGPLKQRQFWAEKMKIALLPARTIRSCLTKNAVSLSFLQNDLNLPFGFPVRSTLH
jgi:hypothetical protein